MDTIKQQQLASLIKETIATIFISDGRSFYGNAFVTITNVRVTPDLLLARIYVSIYNILDKDSIINMLHENLSSIRHKLGNKMRNKVRKIPDLEFYLDDTLDEVFKIEALFDKIKPENID